MRSKLITITGGSGYVGQLLRLGLAERGWRTRIFDRFRGPLTNALRRRYLGASRSTLIRSWAQRIRGAQKRLEPLLINAGVLRPSPDDILALRSQVAERLRGSYAVIHLAGIPHPEMPGATDADFQRVNYEGSINVYEAAREAGVAKFLFASSGQIYGINQPVRIDQLPILETNHCPTLDEGQNLYGWLKLQFERYLESAAASSNLQSISLRLEFPGMQSKTPRNFYISTSIENLVGGFASALEAPASFSFEAMISTSASRYSSSTAFIT